MNSYDFWKTTDFDGERADAIAEARAEARAERVQAAWDAMAYRERAELVDHLGWQFRGQYGYSRKEWILDQIAGRLS